MSEQVRQELPIGIFDSGVGGLTVLNAIRERMPHERLLYLGDTARVPYGTKSRLSILRYAEQASAALIAEGVKALVIACNTASAVAVEHLATKYPDIPVIGVVEPGADACCRCSRTGRIGVIATESTVNNGAYQGAILRRRADASVKALPCSMFVALAEEGWHDGELVEQIVARCLSGFLETKSPIDTLVLGCTHFPVLKAAIAKVVGDQVALVDSAETTAAVLEHRLKAEKLQRDGGSGYGALRYLVTDDPQRFARVAVNFLRVPVSTDLVELVDIQHFS